MQPADRQMEFSNKMLTVQLGKGTAERVRLYKGVLVQGWSGASCPSRVSLCERRHK